MADAVPSVYILNGDDDYAIEQTVAEMLAGLGDPVTAEMNTTRLDGATYNPDQLLTVAGALPFLARRRLVILTNPLAKLNNLRGKTADEARAKFLKQLEQIPPTTALVLVHDKLLTTKKDRRDNKLHWLERWAEARNQDEKHRGSVLVKTFPVPQGAELAKRITKMAREAGGNINADAAELLGNLVDGNLHIAQLEIQKLLAYVNYSHPIFIEDVYAVTVDISEGDIFELVNALVMKNGPKAIKILLRQLEFRTYYEVFGMIVRQFRVLIVAREVIDEGGGTVQITTALRLLKLNDYAPKVENIARQFQMEVLEDAYRRLVQVDEAVKTSQAPDALALEYFVSAFTNAPEQSLT